MAIIILLEIKVYRSEFEKSPRILEMATTDHK